jgi:hypothetical protein
VLKEAELLAGGLTLGPVGGRIVAEVFIGLLQTDPSSWVATQPSFRPTLPPGNASGTFKMLDFLRFARVDPASRVRAAGTAQERPVEAVRDAAPAQ